MKDDVNTEELKEAERELDNPSYIFPQPSSISTRQVPVPAVFL